MFEISFTIRINAINIRRAERIAERVKLMLTRIELPIRINSIKRIGG